jgi:hypothetical protein
VDNRHSDTVGRDAAGFLSHFDHIFPQAPKNLVQKPQSFFHLHLISDATGETLIAAGSVLVIHPL